MAHTEATYSQIENIHSHRGKEFGIYDKLSKKFDKKFPTSNLHNRLTKRSKMSIPIVKHSQDKR